MKKHFFPALLFLLLSMPVWANDGAYYTSGNHLVPLQETDISVRKEVLTITLLDSPYALVDVYYEFYNPTRAPKTVLMGFEAQLPSGDIGDYSLRGPHPYINDFTVEMNGISLDYRAALCRLIPGGIDTLDAQSGRYEPHESGMILDKSTGEYYYETAFVYYFDATFQPGLNKVHHTYAFKVGISNMYCFDLDYKLTPAARWANQQIDDFTLVIRADHTAKHFIIRDSIFPSANFMLTEGIGKYRYIQDCNDWPGSGYEFSLRNGSYTLHLQNFKPEKELYLISADVYYISKLDVYGKKNPTIPFGYYYDRNCSLSLHVYQHCTLPADEAFRRRIARNLPYAHRGRIFKNPELKKHFESLWWYMPDPNYVDDPSTFTDVDREYIQWGKGEELE